MQNRLNKNNIDFLLIHKDNPELNKLELPFFIDLLKHEKDNEKNYFIGQIFIYNINLINLYLKKYSKFLNNKKLQDAIVFLLFNKIEPSKIEQNKLSVISLLQQVFKNKHFSFEKTFKQENKWVIQKNIIDEIYLILIRKIVHDIEFKKNNFNILIDFLNCYQVKSEKIKKQVEKEVSSLIKKNVYFKYDNIIEYINKQDNNIIKESLDGLIDKIRECSKDGKERAILYSTIAYETIPKIQKENISDFFISKFGTYPCSKDDNESSLLTLGENYEDYLSQEERERLEYYNRIMFKSSYLKLESQSLKKHYRNVFLFYKIFKDPILAYINAFIFLEKYFSFKIDELIIERKNLILGVNNKLTNKVNILNIKKKLSNKKELKNEYEILDQYIKIKENTIKNNKSISLKTKLDIFLKLQNDSVKEELEVFKYFIYELDNFKGLNLRNKINHGNLNQKEVLTPKMKLINNLFFKIFFTFIDRYENLYSVIEPKNMNFNDKIDHLSSFEYDKIDENQILNNLSRKDEDKKNKLQKSKYKSELIEFYKILNLKKVTDIVEDGVVCSSIYSNAFLKLMFILERFLFEKLDNSSIVIKNNNKNSLLLMSENFATLLNKAYIKGIIPKELLDMNLNMIRNDLIHGNNSQFEKNIENQFDDFDDFLKSFEKNGFGISNPDCILFYKAIIIITEIIANNGNSFFNKPMNLKRVFYWI